ncbi:hypothetical protein GQ54DRAFT_177879 [Martensiomyces pterosporus]|nr:hypothetical protein GQ54DRAFT_177879 [Martensiomyces pterosporus]
MLFDCLRNCPPSLSSRDKRYFHIASSFLFLTLSSFQLHIYTHAYYLSCQLAVAIKTPVPTAITTAADSSSYNV